MFLRMSSTQALETATGMISSLLAAYGMALMRHMLRWTNHHLAQPTAFDRVVLSTLVSTVPRACRITEVWHFTSTVLVHTGLRQPGALQAVSYTDASCGTQRATLAPRTSTTQMVA